MLTNLDHTITFHKITNADDENIPVICEWLYDWWGKQENYSIEKIQSYVKHSLCENRIPQTHCMKVNGMIAGVFQISMYDIDIRPDIYPWLINVYIEESYRGMGLFHHMMVRFETVIQELQLHEIYIYTEKRNLYERFGWEWIEEFETFLSKRDTQHLMRFVRKHDCINEKLL